MERAGAQWMDYRDDDPTVLIFGDTETGIAAARETAVAHGTRIAAALPIADAAERLDSQIAVDIVIVDVTVDHGRLLDQLLRRIEYGASNDRFAGIVAIAPELIDVSAAQIEHPHISLMVSPDRQALSDAVGDRLLRPQLQFREEGPEMLPMRLPVVGGREDHGHAASGQGEIAADFSDVPESFTALADGMRNLDPAVIRGIIRARRLRNEFFGGGLFADPAWDILLDLMVAKVEQRSVAVSSLCIAAAVPATTALRWIKQLTDMGLLRRVADPQDGRRVFIELSDAASERLMAYFNALIRGRQN